MWGPTKNVFAIVLAVLKFIEHKQSDSQRDKQSLYIEDKH